MMQKPVVEVDTTIAAPPREVWKAMQAGAMFPGTELDTDWQVGHPITLRGEWQGKSFTDRGEIRKVSEARELSFTHWSDRDGSGKRPASWHVVEYALEPSGDGTHVSLRQFNEGAETEVDDKTREEFRKNWAMMLESLKKTAEMH